MWRPAFFLGTWPHSNSLNNALPSSILPPDSAFLLAHCAKWQFNQTGGGREETNTAERERRVDAWLCPCGYNSWWYLCHGDCCYLHFGQSSNDRCFFKWATCLQLYSELRLTHAPTKSHCIQKNHAFTAQKCWKWLSSKPNLGENAEEKRKHKYFQQPPHLHITLLFAQVSSLERLVENHLSMWICLLRLSKWLILLF